MRVFLQAKERYAVQAKGTFLEGDGFHVVYWRTYWWHPKGICVVRSPPIRRPPGKRDRGRAEGPVPAVDLMEALEASIPAAGSR
jgi:hypothetical protein